MARGDAWNEDTSAAFSSTLGAVDITKETTDYTIQNVSKLGDNIAFNSADSSFTSLSTSQVGKMTSEV